jgi:HAMP domain-containing protein
MTKIRNKLLFAFILISLIPLVSIGWFALNNISNSLKASSTAKLNDKVHLISFEIEDFLKNVSNDLFYLRDSVSLRTLIGDNSPPSFDDTRTFKKNIEIDFLAFSKHKKIYHQIRFIDATGMEIIRVDRNRDESSVVAKDRLQNKKKRYYFADTAKMSNGQLMISPLDLNRERGKVEEPLRPVIRYGTPVYNKNNQFKGIVLFNVMADKFLQLVREKKKGYEIYFIDNNGYYYSHKNTQKEWGAETDLNTGENFNTDFPEAAKQIISTKNPSTIILQDNIIASAPVFVDKKKNMTLGNVVEVVPTKNVFHPVVTFRNIFLAISSIVFIVTLFLAIALAKSITEPIIYLTKMTEAMSKGQLTSSVVVSAKDETKILAEAIERLRKSMLILLRRKQK